MRKNLEVEDLGDLLTQAVLAVLSTRRKDGTSLLSPVWFEWKDGGFSVAIWADDIKSKHIKNDPRITILVAEQQPPFRGIEVRGEATISPLPDPVTNLRPMAIRYLGEEAGNEYADGYDGVNLELIRLEPGNIRAWDFRDDLE